MFTTLHIQWSFYCKINVIFTTLHTIAIQWSFCCKTNVIFTKKSMYTKLVPSSMALGGAKVDITLVKYSTVFM